MTFTPIKVSYLRRFPFQRIRRQHSKTVWRALQSLHAERGNLEQYGQDRGSSFGTQR